MTKCFGRDVTSGATLELEFAEAIRSVGPAAGSAESYLAPGFIDIQVNGFAGVDYNDPRTPQEEIGRSLGALFASGVTRFYPTVITGEAERMTAALRNLSRAKDRLPGGEAIDGFHVEGPHISGKDGPRGAHPRGAVRPPDLDEFRRWQEATENRVRIVTLAPEWPTATHYIETITSEGVVAAIGHTGATLPQIRDAVAAGATMSTHLGNGADATMRRHPNYLWDQLAEDRLMASFIVDGIHLDASYLKVALRAKGIERSVLITDAATPAGASPGRYRLGEVEIELTAGDRVVLAGEDRLAGSALRMDRGVGNLMKLGGIGLPQAVQMATVNAARAGRLPGRMLGLAAGERADLVEFRVDDETGHIRVMATWVSGRRVFAG